VSASRHFDTRIPFIKNLTPGEKAGLLVVVALAFVVRIYQLDSQMWLDEFSALRSIRRSWLDIVTTWPGPSSHVLFEVLSSWSASIFGESAFSLRLPAALFGIASVYTLVQIGSRIYSVKAGLFIAALMAVSYNHVFFSQNARGYTALIFFFLWSSYVFMRIVDSRGIAPKTGFLYCMTVIAACYCQPFGVFVPAAHFVIAIALIYLDRKNDNQECFPLAKFIYWQVGAGIATLILYSPFIANMKELAEGNVVSAAAGPRFELGLILEIAEGLSAAFFGYVGLAVATVIGMVGVVIWISRSAASFYILTLPIVIQLVVFFIMGVGIHPRYFAIAIPVVYVAGGISVFYLSSVALERIVSAEKNRQLIQAVILSVLVVVSMYPLVRYYTIPKQDFKGAFGIVEKSAAEDDTRIGIATVGMIGRKFYGLNYIRVDRLDELQEREKDGKRVWVVMTLERLIEKKDPSLVEHIKTNYELLQRLPGTVGGGSMQVYRQLDSAR
jgi:hypothetical protein